MISKGCLHKMSVELDNPIRYRLKLDTEIELNNLIGQAFSIEWTGSIFCQKCAKKTKSSFGEGFCYTCFTTAPEAAECIIRPELCRAHLGEGRDIEWEERNHNQPHVVYLAKSSGVKVGITRKVQVPTRWIDQGASEAIILAETPNRYLAGTIEVALKDFFTDKTNWQKMLKNEIDESIDLAEEKWNLEDQLPNDIRNYFTDDEESLELHYPVQEYPVKVKSISLDKLNKIEAKLLGIKGQYLLFENGLVMNVRKHTGYEVEIHY